MQNSLLDNKISLLITFSCRNDVTKVFTAAKFHASRNTVGIILYKKG